MPGLVEVAKRFLADVGDVAGDVFRPELGVAGHDFEFLDVDRGEDVVLDDALGDEDRILIIVAIPRHERDEHVAAERELAELGRRAVGDDLAGSTVSPTFTSGRWLMQVFWFERWNFISV